MAERARGASGLVEVYSETRRLHSTLGCVSPAEFGLAGRKETALAA